MPNDSRTRSRTAFTLVELLVVIAVIALLIGILVPALGGARAQARALTIANNLRSISQAANSYAANNQVLPPSYVYGSKESGGSWRIDQQQETNPNAQNGYIHWSWSIFDGDDSKELEAFQSPVVTSGGAPRTNPGRNPDDWEPGQRNDSGSECCAEIPEDRQAARVAFTGNAAIFPRNKFRNSANSGPRWNKLVDPSLIKQPSRTILATEFLDINGWRSLEKGSQQGDQDTGTFGPVKSHRSVLPFLGQGTGLNVYLESDSGGFRPKFRYPIIDSELLPADQLGSNMIESATALNAVGRYHPGGNSIDGGTTHFVFVDGHIERLLLKDTITKRLWGDRFYSITGSNTKILDLSSN